MTEYVSKQTVKAEILAAYADGRIATAEDIVKVLDAVPPADVKPALHSRWLPHGNIVYDLYKCAWCGHVIQNNDITLPCECPACHARMHNSRKERKHGASHTEREGSSSPHP